MSEITGAQRPRLLNVPMFKQSSGQECVDLARLAGLELDEWQQFVLLNSLGERDDGRWTAATCGLVVGRQNGKNPHWIGEEILTTDGWVTFADIESGQFVYGSDGQPTRVVGRTEVFPDERCYEVQFTDGAKCVVGEGHLWPVQDKGVWVTKTTSEIANSRWGFRRPNGRMEYRYRVRCDAVVDTPEAALPIDPYVFGYWLGDGHKGNATITVGHEDLEHVRQSITQAGYRVVSESLHQTGRAWCVNFNINKKVRDGFESRIKALGVWNDKHIPEVYLTASPAQRKALLEGLMDSDGSIGAKSQVEFSSSYPRLAESFHRLARSLGIKTTPRWRKTKCKENCRFTWTPAFNPFRLPRKAAGYQRPASQRHELMSIVNVREVPSVPTRCIQVEAEDGLYLVGRLFTPTHNSILEARELFGLFVLGENLIVHTAHLQTTASEQFRRLRQRIEGVPDFEARVAKVNMGKGSEAIELKSGQRILFATRTASVARGLTIDMIVYDEAMHLSEDERSSITPTMAARSMDGNTQTWYTGSAVDQQNPKHNGIPFAQIRDQGIKGADRVAYFEWSAPGDDPDRVSDAERCDVNLIAMANPGLGIRISREWVEHERLVELGPRGFAVERMGVGDWPDPNDLNHRAIPVEAWDRCLDFHSKVDSRVCLALDITPDRSAASICAAALRADGKVHVEIIRHERYTDWVLDELTHLMKVHKPYALMIDSRSQGRSFEERLAAAKVKSTITNSHEYASACGNFYDAVMQGTLVHIGEEDLTDAVLNATKRPLGDAWGWDKKSSATDISPLVGCTLAYWGNQLFAKKKKGRIVDLGEALRIAETEGK